MKTKFDTRSLVLLGLLTAVVFVFSFTPIGSIPVGPLVITLNVIPVAVGAIALGPVGGLIMGSVFGLFSFLQCFGIGITSSMGAILADIDPFLAFVQRFVPRALDGFLAGCIFRSISKVKSLKAYYIITGIISALFGLALFLSLMLLISYDKKGKYSMSEEMYALMSSKGLIAYICLFVSILCFVIGYMIISSKKLTQIQAACSITGFCTALMNTIFFMTALVVLFGNTEYMKEKIDGRNILVFVITFVGINALFEMVVSTVITGAVGSALHRSKLIKTSLQSPKK